MTTTEQKHDDAELLARTAVAMAIDKKAERIVMINPGPSSALADWFIICESDNTVHNTAIADAIVRGLREQGTHVWQSEGLEDGRWILLDYSDVVINVMLPEVRQMYNLEGIFKGSTIIEVDEKTFTV